MGKEEGTAGDPLGTDLRAHTSSLTGGTSRCVSSGGPGGHRGSSGRRSSQSERLRELTRTATPATPVGRALESLPVDPRLHEGIKAYKVCSNGAIVERLVTLGRGNFIVFVTPQRVPGAKHYTASTRLKVIRQRVRKNPIMGKSSEEHHTPRYLDVADITDVQSGFIGTHKLELCKSKYLGKRRLLSITSLTRGWSRVTVAADHVIERDRVAIVSIVYGAKRDTLDLLIPDDVERKLFVDALLLIREAYHDAKETVSSDELLLRYIWYEVDMNNNGRIDRRELKRVMKRINISHKGSLKTDYRAFVQNECMESRRELAKAYHRGLDYRGCLSFIRLHKSRSGVWDILFGKNTEQVTADIFLEKFLHGKQHEYSATLLDANVIFAQLHGTGMCNSPRNKEKDGSRLSIDRSLFDIFLHSAANDAYDPASLEFDKDTMNYSLSEYFINSSHNTYLMGDQLKSTSSVEMYMAALQRGCKCLEIDCWDGDIGDEIIVYHGYSLTSRVAFDEVIDCVRQYVNNHPTTYPIILSLENHCSLPRQQKMAVLLKSKLGDRLYIPKSSDLWSDLPSPCELKGLVVIKGKRPPEPDNTDIVSKHDEDESVYDPYDEALRDPSPSTSCVAEQKKAEKSSGETINHELAQITLFHGCAFQSFEKSLSLSPSHMHSLNEAAIGKILSKAPSNAELWVEYNRRHITRIYPSGSRVDSSNYSPLLPWTLGCQMVSLNFQTADSPLIVNDGFFQRNGGCGYILKPKSLRGKDLSTSALLPNGPQTLRVRVVSGSCLPKPNGESDGEIIDPYVRVRLHDVVIPDIKKNGKGSNRFLSSSVYPRGNHHCARQVTTLHTTRCVLDNGFSPVWRQNSWAEFRVHNDMAVLQFCVRDKDYGNDESVAEAAIPVSCLRSGYRCVRLFDKHNTRSGPFDMATLLIEVEYLRPSLVEVDTNAPARIDANSLVE